MRNLLVFGIVLGMSTLLGCYEKASRDEAPEPSLRQFDTERSKQVPVVARVEVLENSGGSAYLFVRARVVELYKNETNIPIAGEIAIAYLSSGSPLPEGKECTVYLRQVKVEDAGYDLWHVDETLPDANNPRAGFSHVAQ